MGPAQKRVLEVIIDDHLRRKTKLGEGGKEWLGNVQVHLETFESFFGAQRDLADIELRGLEDYRAHLFTLPNGRGGTLTTGSIAQYLNSASNLYERAIKDQLLDAGKNLVALLPPLEIKRVETPFLELDEMAEVLRFAFEEYEAARDDLAIPFVAVILALLALTGLREKEALGLLRSDVDLRRRIIHVRPNHFRPRLKTKTSERVAPIFSQLLEIRCLSPGSERTPASTSRDDRSHRRGRATTCGSGVSRRGTQRPWGCVSRPDVGSPRRTTRRRRASSSSTMVWPDAIFEVKAHSGSASTWATRQGRCGARSSASSRRHVTSASAVTAATRSICRTTRHRRRRSSSPFVPRGTWTPSPAGFAEPWPRSTHPWPWHRSARWTPSWRMPLVRTAS